MKKAVIKKTAKDYLPILVTVIFAIITLTLIFTGVIDLDMIPEIVEDNRIAAIAIVMLLFVLKGFSGALLYDAIVIIVSVLFPIWNTIVIVAVGTAVEFTISYYIGRFTKTQSISHLLEANPKINKYFNQARQYGFVFCFAVHTIGLNMEVLGIIFGIMRIGYLRYLVSAWLGIMPGAICFILIGSKKDFGSPLFWISFAFNMVMIAFGIIYIKNKEKIK